ncbi:MAG: LamG-like jellyroll fold domain-containing protein, partial [Limisphaerales bacterium]
SHLFPHQFARAPGNVVLLAQGAFNFSQVRDRDGRVTEFNRTKLARFRPDGTHFEIIGWGPCNIWGLEMNRLGEFFIQEANDQRWPMMPFLEGASYPLCGDDVPRPYAPPFPKLGKQDMGGTGLSGLALSEGGDSFPAPWRDVFFVANPITRKIQALRLHRELGEPDLARPVTDTAFPKWELEHLPDFVLSSDPWFRPIAMAFGPDGCLYIVDWYNAIISHNEVPRAHPDRDKTRGRIWRVRHESQPHRTNAPNLSTAPDAALLTHLAATNSWEANAAWQQIIDRGATNLVPSLAGLVTDAANAPDFRLRAAWALESLSRLELTQVETLLAADHTALVREGLRLLRTMDVPPGKRLELARQHLEMRWLARDRRVTQEALRLLGGLLALEPSAFGARPPEDSSEPVVNALVGYLYLLQHGFFLNVATGGGLRSYHDDFEAYLARAALERHPGRVRAWLEDPRVGMDIAAPSAAPRLRAIGCLALGGTEGGQRLAKLAFSLQRPFTTEELVLVAAAVPDAGAQTALQAALMNGPALQALYDQRGRFTNSAPLAPLLTDAARGLVARDPSPENLDVLVRVATGFRLAGLEPELVQAATAPGAPIERQRAALRALREAGSARVDVFAPFARSGDDVLRREAVTALAAAKSDAAVPALLDAWGTLPPALRRLAVERLASTPASARLLVAAVEKGAITRDELDGDALDRLATVLPDDAAVKRLVEELGGGLQPVLRLTGDDADYVDEAFTLAGPFTVETWVRLDPGISSQDSILAGPEFDANFHDARFRLWLGTSGDVVIASRPAVAEAWTHFALTRDGDGVVRLFLNGELDVTSTVKDTRTFTNLFIARGNVAGGTAGALAEFRVWNIARTPDEIRAAANLVMNGTSGALIYAGSGTNWGRLHGKGRVERTADTPPLQTPAEAATVAGKFAQFRTLAAQPGDVSRGREVFTTACAGCHTLQGTGGKIGPALDGAGAHGIEALLRNVLLPDAAMEAGYRRFRVETADGEITEGLLAAQDAESVTLRQQNAEDQRLPRALLKRAGFVRGSVMPSGLLEALNDDDARALLTFLLTLK